ncbi:MAG TPA: type II toxin-antitoxin system RelE/ParE family toxin [Acidobacteriota bacterium]|nr:type II toxin-antitoxin system RelE/ParE family toxin [Acidobacteriota bacterium]
MRTAFRKSFERDLKKLRKDRQLLRRIREVIEEVEAAGELKELSSLKKLVGGSGQFYRFRLGDYRVGLEIEGTTAVFVRCLHRRDIYRYFP